MFRSDQVNFRGAGVDGQFEVAAMRSATAAAGDAERRSEVAAADAAAAAEQAARENER